jgi:hypothetical protein
MLESVLRYRQRPGPVGAQTKYSKLLDYLLTKDQRLAQQMSQDGLSPDKKELNSLRSAQLNLLLEIQDEIVRIESGSEEPRADSSPTDDLEFDERNEPLEEEDDIVWG